MRTTLEEIAPRFVDLARAVDMAVAATVGGDGRPRTRVVQPRWEWSDGTLVGWVTTQATAPKVDDLRRTPVLSLTYWHPSQDTATADCAVALVDDPVGRVAAWTRFTATGVDLGGHWSGPDDPGFAVLRLDPTALRTMDGSLMTTGTGDLLTWR